MRNVLELTEMIAEAVQPMSVSKASLLHFGSRNNRIYSAAVVALSVYACCCSIGAWAYSNYCQRAARALPVKCDVLMAGSSVINTPLMYYEFPGKDCSILSDRFPVLETPRLERLLSHHGASDLTVFDGASFGQSIEETEDFIRGVVSLNKHPRLVVLFVAPLVTLGGHNPQYYGLLPSKVAHSLQLWQRSFEEFHYRVAIQIKLMTYFLYGSTTLPEPRSTHWQRVDANYKRSYRSNLNAEKVGSIRRIVDMCSEHSIPTIVVSTPLAPSNRALLSTFSYAYYHQAIQELFTPAKVESTASRNVTFVDLGEDARFIQGADFDDGIHLNGEGGKKMFDLLAPTIVGALRRSVF
jgi:hypothetical protein